MVDADETSFAPVPQLARVQSTAAPRALRIENKKIHRDVLSAKGRDLGPEMHDPPPYLMPNWNEAEQSVVITGHGPPLRCENLRARLHELANNFSAIAVPEGRPEVLDPGKPGKSENDAYR
ncbi:hypothetical protein AGR4B_pAt20206 [Agrobacterium tumefaciens str. CFBP 5621]|jgi:hypothetical protein|nr:hypothetical protein AGR4B_pAt20206 [Agrobacterium tumefaciens str. CFBP 5621]